MCFSPVRRKESVRSYPAIQSLRQLRTSELWKARFARSRKINGDVIRQTRNHSRAAGVLQPAREVEFFTAVGIARAVDSAGAAERGCSRGLALRGTSADADGS